MTKLKVTLTNIPNLIKLRFNGTIAQQNSLYGQFGGYETFARHMTMCAGYIIIKK